MKPDELRALQSKLLQWGKKNYRDYPWRHTRDPYQIMIAEFMLHRTRADQVVPIFIQFLQKYPDVYALAEADPSEIGKVTEHLGLHWRSGHFIAAAKYVVEHYHGTFPRDEKQLLAIPGVGDYVSSAIITVCYNKPHRVVDANIARFINRFFGLYLSGEIRRRKEILELADVLFDIDEPGKFLFAILDFSAAICKSKNPLHQECPLRTNCIYNIETVQYKC
ncbi:hypothetical protein [Methanocalculus sp.]|uniref:hypothetical protein n=1 Tax=Methanocalculus sp. TaxID=2004547 RepID=UPI00261CEB85|nr:hypothetical protein [Methanocalculus sp.]MDG6249405.1 hypothetical protein [Methanocalculus sp.]